MVASERNPANTLFSFSISLQINPQEPSADILMDIEIDTSRGWSMFSSTDSSKEISVHSDVFFIIYVDCIQALADNPTWTEQVELNETKRSALSYTFLKEEETELADKTNTTEPMPDPHRMVSNNMCLPQGLKSSAIPYLVNQPAGS